MSYADRAQNYINALGGIDNIKTIDNCVARLRLELHDIKKVNKDDLTKCGSKGTIYVGENKFHLIIGSCVMLIANAMHEIKKDGTVCTVSEDAEDLKKSAQAYIDALGGVNNIDKIDHGITRLILEIKNMNGIDEKAISKLRNERINKISEHELDITIGVNVAGIAEFMLEIYNK